MADLAELELRIRSTEVEVATLRLKVFGAEAAKTQGAVSLLEKQFQSLNSTVQKFRIAGSLLAAGFITTRVANSALINTIKEYETALVTLRHVAVDSTASLKEQQIQFKQLEEAARNIGRTTVFSAVEGAEALLILSKAGLDAKEAVAASIPVLSLAQGQLISVEQAAQTVISALQQFGIAAVDAGRVVDVLSETSNRTSTDVTNLGEALKFVGPIAASLDQELEQVASALGILSNAGVQGSLAGTTLRGVLTALAAPTDIAEKAIDSLVLTIDDLNPATHSLEEIVQTLRNSFLSSVEAVDIFNRRNASTALILANNTEEFSKLIKQQEAARGETLRLARAQNDTLAGAFKRLSAAFKENVLNATGFKDALRSTTEFLVGVFQIFSGSADAITKANENLQAFVGAVKASAIAVGILISAMSLNAILQWGNAILKAAGAVATLNAVVKINPLFLLAAGGTAAFFAIKKLTGELRSAEEAFSKVGNKEDDERFASLANNLKFLNHQIEQAKGIGDFNKALDLAKSKVAILESELEKITFVIKEDPKNAKIKQDIANDILKETRSGEREFILEATLQINADVRKGLEKEIKDKVASLLKSITTDAPLFEDAKKRFSLDNIIPTDKLFISDELRARLQKQVDDFLNSVSKGSAVQRRFLGETKTADAINSENKAKITEIFDFIAAEAARQGDLGKFDLAKIFGPQGQALQVGIDVNKEELARLEKAAETTFDRLVPKKTDQDIQDLDKLTVATEKSIEAVAELSAELRTEQAELRATIGLSELSAGAKKQEIEAINLISAARKNESARIAIDKADILAKLNAAKKNEEGAKARGVTIDGLEKALARLVNREKELTDTYAKEQIEILRLVQANKTLAEARNLAEEAAEAKEDVKTTLIQNVQAVRQEAFELEKKVKLLKASSDAEKAFIEAEFFKAEVIRQLTQDQEDNNASTDSLVDSLFEYEKAVVKLTEEEKKLTAAQKETKKSTQAESDALAKITRDLGLELSLIGASNIEKEAAIRLRQISTNLIESENKKLAEQGEAIEKLRPSIEVTIRALDQGRKAAQFGRDIARSFSDPIKDFLKGGSLEDAAKDMLERLFDVFIDATIFQPLEDKFAEIFGGNKGVQQIVAQGKFVDDEAIAAATAAIDKVSQDLADKLKNATDGLNTSTTAGVLFATKLLEGARELKEAVRLALGGPPGGVIGGAREAEPFAPDLPKGFFPPARRPAQRRNEDALEDLFNAPASSRFPPRTESISVQTTELDIGELEREVIIADESVSNLARAIQGAIEQVQAGEVPGLQVSGQQIVSTGPNQIEGFPDDAINSVLSQLTAASIQLAQSFSPLPQTSANLVQAAAQMQSAAPQLDSAASKLQTAVSGAGTPAPVPGAGGAASFASSLFEQLFAKGKGLLQSILSGFFGFAVPFQKGGVIENNFVSKERLVERFAQGGAFTNKVVSKATVAPLAMFGEAGPEAIMPLRKTGRGGLGVSAFLAGKEVSVLKLTRGGGGKLGVDFKSLVDDNKTKRFALGGVFSDENKNVNLTGSSPGQPANSQQAKAGKGSETAGQSYVFNNVYRFEKGVTPDEAFHRSRRQFEADLRDSTRRVK